jgi:hypothetical protein
VRNLIKIRIYRKGNEVLLAACDSELMGKSFEDGELRLKVSSFYDGVEVDREGFLNGLRFATIANFVGERVVGIAIEEGFVDRERVIRIQGVPHAQMVLM